MMEWVEAAVEQPGNNGLYFTKVRDLDGDLMCVADFTDGNWNILDLPSKNASVRVWLDEGPCCRKCGCTDDDCGQCIEATGVPCYWVEATYCSRCKAEQEATAAS